MCLPIPTTAQINRAAARATRARLQIAATVLFNGGTIYFLLAHFNLTQGGAHAGNPDMILTPPSSSAGDESDAGEGSGDEEEGGLAALCVPCSHTQLICLDSPARGCSSLPKLHSLCHLARRNHACSALAQA